MPNVQYKCRNEHVVHFYLDLWLHVFECRQTCLIQTDVDPTFLFGLGEIRIMHVGIICIGRDRPSNRSGIDKNPDDILPY